MRPWLVLLIFPLLLSGCFSDTPIALVACDGDPHPVTLYLQEDGSLGDSVPVEGAVPGNGFTEAFLSNDIGTWDSDPVTDALQVDGVVELEFWARNSGTPAPIVLGGDPGEAYHFFNQFGSDRSLQPAYAIEYADAAPLPGSVDHYVERFELAPGGFRLETGDRVRLLLTSLVLDAGDQPGHDILVGGATPSRLRFTARCIDQPEWDLIDRMSVEVDIPANQGLLTGAIPAAEGINQQQVPFDLDAATDRLTIRLVQDGSVKPVKDDMDLRILDSNGTEVWSIGSPYSDEQGVLWRPNLDALFPPGPYIVEVTSYSGTDYHGRLTIRQDAA